MLKHKLRMLSHVKHFISSTFSSVSDFNNIVKNKEFYTNVCSELKIEPEQMLYVGDHVKHDLQIPRSLGINALLIDREQEADGDHVIHTLADLRPILQNRFSS